jgi:xylulokinase
MGGNGATESYCLSLQTWSQSDAAVTVGIDVGTSSVKAVAADGGGRVLARARIPHALVTDSPYRLEHDARAAWCEGPRRALDEVVGQLRDDGQPVPRAVAVSAMVPSLTPVDGDGMPIGPGVLYDDERGRSSGLGGDDDPTRSLETLTLLTWAAATYPAARGYWPAQAVANRALGGPPAIDLGTAFSTGPLFGGDGWDALRLARAGVDRSQLPDMVMFGETIGKVDRLPSAALVAGGVDALCEEMVAGPLSPGDVLVVCGSTLVVWVVTENELSIDQLTQRVPPDGLWRLPSLTRGLTMVGGPSNAGGLFLDWVDHLVRPATDNRLDPRRVPVWRPYLRGERVPFHDPGLRGGLSDLDVTHTPAALRRAAYEASAMALRMIVERAGARPKRIVATGGGSQVQGWLRAIADVTGVPVEPVAVPEGAALGAAWLARIGARLETSIDDAGRWAAYRSVVEPDPGWIAPCAERYRQYVQQYELGAGFPGRWSGSGR